MTKTQNRLWTVDEYHRIIEAGILTTEDKVELLEGRIIQMSAQRPPHAATTQRIDRYFQNLLRGQADIRSQLPITLSTSEPEPDIAVVRIAPGGYADHHPAPNEILLLIEVTHTTLRQGSGDALSSSKWTTLVTDRGEKALIYARATIADYWILDIVSRRVYIFRNPSNEGYQSITVLDQDAAIESLAFPGIEIPFSELFLP